VRPVEPGTGEQPHGAVIEARMHAIAVELDFVQPAGPLGRLTDKLGELGPYPFRKSGRGGAAARYRPRHAESEER